MASFVSSNELAKARSIKRKLQNEALISAKSDYVKQQVFEEEKRRNKQDQWVTSSLERRLKADDNKHKSSYKPKKAHKKHKKKKKKAHSSSSDDSSDDAWVEKQPTEKHDAWIDDDILSGISTYSSKDLRAKANKEKEKINVQTKQLTSFDQPGQHQKELNPFWKSGGDGLPSVASKSETFIPDAEWLERSLTRMQEQSQDSGRSLDSIATERYGSLQAFYTLLEKARQKVGKSSSAKPRRFMKPVDADKPCSKKFAKPSDYHTTPRWKKQKTDDVSKPIKSDHSCKETVLEVQNIEKATEKKSSNVSVGLQKSENEPKQTELKVLTEEEKNKIGAKIIKAELMGNMTLVEKLKKKLEKSRNAEEELNALSVTPSSKKQPRKSSIEKAKNKSSSSGGSSSEEETVVLMRTSRTGQSWPVTGPNNIAGPKQKQKKRKKTIMHDKEGQRERYFADDDKYSLKDLVEQEKTGASEDNVRVMSRLSAKAFTKAGGDAYTLDDMFEAEAGRFTSVSASDRQTEISKNKKLLRRLENCKLCFGNPENPKHLVIAAGRVAYLKIPSYRVLQPGHCIIAPMHHNSAGTNVDEDVWDEMRKFMQALCNMFAAEDKDCVFIQTCSHLSKSPHFYMECIPLPRDLGDVAPIYFKKAIQECESEWSQNKKLVDTRGKTVKDKIPAGLPYFAVDFGLSGGFAHVIEDEMQFPNYFGREILGGMLDADPYLWRKPRDETFNDQMKRSIEFEKSYKSFDWTNTEIR